MVFHCAQNLRPAPSKVIADEHKCGDPHHRSRICEQGEAAVFHLRRPCDNCSEVTHTGDKVAHHECPVADFIEPRMHTLNVLILDVQKLSHARMQKLPAYSSADNVAASDSAGAAGQCAGDRGNQGEMALIHQEATT